MILALLFLSILLPTPTASQGGNTTLPLSLPPRVLTATEQTCPSDEMREMMRSQMNQDIRTLLRDNIICPAARTQSSPAASCSAISTSCPSGNYWIRSSTGSAVQVYCDMDRVCDCDSTRGWARIAYLNITDTSQQCPGEWTLVTTPRRTCARSISGGSCTDRCYSNSCNIAGCNSAIFSSSGISYSCVCGQVIGYQNPSPRAFDTFLSCSTTIESYYLDGVSVTHGVPGSRQHIWSFAAAFGGNSQDSFNCPCHSNTGTPPYVGQDYFCETGNDNAAASMFFADDPLWDGQNCMGNYTCECTFNNPPWFCKQLPQATTDDIEVRICHDSGTEVTPVELVELYIR